MAQVTVSQRTPEWFAARRGLITASLVGAVLGLSPYKTPKAAWREIMGQQTEAEQRTNGPGTPAHFGTLFEPAARLAYEAKTGAWVEETGLWISDEHPWLGASVDGLIRENGVIVGALECKAPEFCSHKILPCYRLQMAVQMAVLNCRYADFAQYSWRTGEIWVERVYPLSPVGEAALIKRLKAWWERHIRDGEEPGRKKPRRRKIDHSLRPSAIDDIEPELPASAALGYPY
jgi:putative phage-type endonuclease